METKGDEGMNYKKLAAFYPTYKEWKQDDTNLYAAKAIDFLSYL